MYSSNRREFMRVSGAVLGGVFAGSTVVAAERTDRFIVDTRGLKPGALRRADVEILTRLEEIDIAIVKGAEEAVSSVTNDFAPDIETTQVEPDTDPREADTETSDPENEPFYPFQWDKQAINAAAAQETATGEGTTIAVIDTGVDPDHPDLEPVVDEDLSRNFVGDDPNPDDFNDRGYHGTFVAGIAASSVNEEGIAGVAPDTDVVGLRVFPDTIGSGATFGDILEATVYAVNIDADVANFSLGAYPIPRQQLGGFYGGVLNRTFTFANKEDTLLVVAAGNDAANLQQDGGVLSLPNEAAQAVGVAATAPVGFAEEGDPTDPPEEPFVRPASYTNYGTNAINVAAPGGDFVGGSTIYDLVTGPAPPEYIEEEFGVRGFYLFAAGTSFAAPQVAGIAVLLRDVDPSLNANQLRSVIERTASVPKEYDKRFYGAGFVDAAAAVEEVAGNNGNGKGNGK